MMNARPVWRLVTIAILLTSSLFLCFPSHSGEPNLPIEPTVRVAVIDMSEAFQGYSRWRDKMEALKTDMESADAEAKQQEEDLRKLRKALEQLNGTGHNHTATREQLEREMSQAYANIYGNVKACGPSFAEREATIYFDAYREVTRVADDYARANGIGLVLRVSSDVPARQDPGKVLQYISRDVIWYDESIDITAEITGALNETVADKPVI